MKVLVLALAIGVIVSLAGDAAIAQEQKGDATGVQHGGLELSLVSQKRSYKRNDQFKLQVMLVNPTSKPVYVFGTLDWGYSASLMFYIRDSSGREIEPKLSPDSQTYATADDKSAFVKLEPDHFFGTTYFAPLSFMNLNKPGRYAISVEYISPFSIAEVELKPFLGKESGPLKSNVVWIEVVR
ncbi:MAG: hypothetical protein H7Z16_00325 [Pyrinomonadaceae bacterium]|nr:hypothetical protein [Pyrinomonadaceae bacterium]